jgi:hypothetical protein
LQKKLDEIRSTQEILSLLAGDSLAAKQQRDTLIFSGDYLHKRPGGLFRRKHNPKNELKDAWAIPTVNA